MATIAPVRQLALHYALTLDVSSLDSVIGRVGVRFRRSDRDPRPARRHRGTGGQGDG
jgi:hypothetical protein